jgi:hypothetical protein
MKHERRSRQDELEVLIETVLPERLKPQVVWHYTSPDVAQSIIEKRAFWASSVVTTNDRSEMLYGMEFVNACWGERRGSAVKRDRVDRWLVKAEKQLLGQRRSDSYVLCASMDPDSIPQWDRYGYCELGIYTEVQMTKNPNPDEDGGRLGPTFTTGWRAVIYDLAGQRAHASRLFDVLEELSESDDWTPESRERSADRAGIECILRSIVCLKHPGFVSEREVRLYGQAKPTGARVDAHWSPKFGASSHILVRTSVRGLTGDDMPIVAVRVGNITDEAPATAQTLETLLTDDDGIDVLLVETPFR